MSKLIRVVRAAKTLVFCALVGDMLLGAVTRYQVNRIGKKCEESKKIEV
jgi:hypothetical protein